MDYLNEKRLGEFLDNLYPNKKFIHDKTVPNSNSRRRPDYRCEELKLIVEFDGLNHYTEANKILNEEEKTNLYKSMGYKVVRVPYFIQLSSYTIKVLFSEEYEIKQTYPHGFVDKKCILPCDFCEMGVEKFEKDLEKFPLIKIDIIDSLINKIKEKEDIRRVLPKSLVHLIENV